jgi:hypothetical protein
MPPPDPLQYLFRSAEGLRCLLGGGRLEDAAFRARYTDPGVFRRSLQRRFDMGVREFRRQTWDSVLDRWREFAFDRAERLAALHSRPCGHAR